MTWADPGPSSTRESAMMARLAALVRGCPGPRSPEADSPADAVADAALRHGVLPLIYGVLEPDAGPLRAALATLARNEAAADAIRDAECRRVYEGLHDAGLPVLVFKGGALAFSHYPRPDLRPRDDTDILIEGSARLDADRVLTGLGFEKLHGTDGRLISYQSQYTRIDPRGIHHNIDVHWRISNRQRYASLLELEELLARSRALAGHPDYVRCPCPVDALLIAALHRAVHRGTDRLIWLYDVHLLMAALEDGERAELDSRIASKDLVPECRAAMDAARHFFGGVGRPPPAAARMRTIDVWLADLKALPTWRGRLEFLMEHAFPPAEYMRRSTGHRRSAFLPAAYIARAIRGSLKIFRRA